MHARRIKNKKTLEKIPSKLQGRNDKTQKHTASELKHLSLFGKQESKESQKSEQAKDTNIFVRNIQLKFREGSNNLKI